LLPEIEGGYRWRSIRIFAKDIDRCQYPSVVKSLAVSAADCAPLLEDEIGKADALRVAGLLKVIAEPARLRLLSLIQAQPNGEACVCHLTTPLGLSQPTVSHHLKVLLEAGLVEREQRGSWAYFRVRREPLAAIRSILA
jgi:ArsR family transcriptional regulator, arsenate/arsenite/antimonite-responsive transcriptional repressor